MVLRKLSGADPEGRRHCIKLLRTFDYRGHLCLVFEAMVSTLSLLCLLLLFCCVPSMALRYYLALVFCSHGHCCCLQCHFGNMITFCTIVRTALHTALLSDANCMLDCVCVMHLSPSCSLRISKLALDRLYAACCLTLSYHCLTLSYHRQLTSACTCRVCILARIASVVGAVWHLAEFQCHAGTFDSLSQYLCICKVHS